MFQIIVAILLTLTLLTLGLRDLSELKQEYPEEGNILFCIFCVVSTLFMIYNVLTAENLKQLITSIVGTFMLLALIHNLVSFCRWIDPNLPENQKYLSNQETDK